MELGLLWVDNYIEVPIHPFPQLILPSLSFFLFHLSVVLALVSLQYKIKMSKEHSQAESGSNSSNKDMVIETIEEIGYGPKETKTLLRKMDKALLPFLALLYLLSFLDRSNIGNAKLAGLEKSLGMEGYDYSVS